MLQYTYMNVIMFGTPGVLGCPRSCCSSCVRVYCAIVFFPPPRISAVCTFSAGGFGEKNFVTFTLLPAGFVYIYLHRYTAYVVHRYNVCVRVCVHAMKDRPKTADALYGARILCGKRTRARTRIPTP